MYTGDDSFEGVKKTLFLAIQHYIDTSHNWQPETENEHELMAEWEIYERGEWITLRDRVPTLTGDKITFDDMIRFNIACSSLRQAVTDAMKTGNFEFKGQDVQQLWGDIATMFDIMAIKGYKTPTLQY